MWLDLDATPVPTIEVLGKKGELPALLSANGMNENSLIVPGQQLFVPQGGSLPAPAGPKGAVPST